MHLRSVAVGVSALRSNPLRTLLSTLGVVIGVASLVAVLALGDGIERYAREQIAQTTDVQVVQVTPRTTETVDGVRVPGNRFPRFTISDIEAVTRDVPGIAEAALALNGSARFLAHGALRAAIVLGTTSSFDTTMRTVSGRWFSADELREGRRVAVISARIAELLGNDSLVLEGRVWPVVGVMHDQRRDSILRVAVPAAVAADAMVPSEWPRAPTLFVKAHRVEDVERVRAGVERWLAARDSTWLRGVTIATNTGRARQARQGALVFKLFMGAITGISLLVGGIGIMNVLLASVVERTREIGIRKAAGARPRDVLVQFLAESVTIAGAGSVIGVVLGLVGAFAVTAAIRAQTQASVYAAFTWSTVAVAVLAAGVVGMAFGTYPALRAARLSPIDAMRHE